MQETGNTIAQTYFRKYKFVAACVARSVYRVCFSGIVLYLYQTSSLIVSSSTSINSWFITCTDTDLLHYIHCRSNIHGLVQNTSVSTHSYTRVFHQLPCVWEVLLLYIARWLLRWFIYTESTSTSQCIYNNWNAREYNNSKMLYCALCLSLL